MVDARPGLVVVAQVFYHLLLKTLFDGVASLLTGSCKGLTDIGSTVSVDIILSSQLVVGVQVRVSISSPIAGPSKLGDLNGTSVHLDLGLLFGMILLIGLVWSAFILHVLIVLLGDDGLILQIGLSTVEMAFVDLLSTLVILEAAKVDLKHLLRVHLLVGLRNRDLGGSPFNATEIRRHYRVVAALVTVERASGRVFVGFGSGLLRDKRLESFDFEDCAAKVVLVLLNGLWELLDLELLLSSASLLNQGHMFAFYDA